MSSLTTRVLYDLVARDNASRVFNKVSGSAAGLESRTAKAGAAIAKGLAVGTLAAGALAAASADMATHFQASMTKVSTQAGATRKDVKVLSDDVLALGGKVQQGPDALADSLYHLKSVGLDNAKAMKALREASDLAAVGGADLEETTNALAGAWRTGIKGAGDFHQAVATVNAIIGAGNMRMSDFNAAIGTGILASAKTFGLSLQQVGAALALMTDEGIPATDAATRLRMSFSLLGAPSQAAEKQLKKIGLTGLDLAKAMRGPDGLIGAVSLLKTHLDASGMSAAQESQLLSRAFGGGRSSSGILTLLNNLDVLRQKQDQVNKSTAKFDAAVKAQRQTAEAEWKRLESALESGSVRLGLALLPPITGFVGWINDKALPAAGKLSSALGSLVPVGKIKSAVGDVQSTIGGFLSGLTGSSGIGGFVKGLTGAKTPKPKSPIDKFPTTVLKGDLSGAPHLGSGQTSATPKGKALAAEPHYGVGQVAPSNGRIAKTPDYGPHGGSGLAAPLIKAPKAAAPKSPAEQLGAQLRSAVTSGIGKVNWGTVGSSLGKSLAGVLGKAMSKAVDLGKMLGDTIAKTDWLSLGKKVGSTAIPFIIGFINNLFEPLFSADFWSKHWKDIIYFAVTLIPIGRAAGAIGKVLEHIPFLKAFAPLLRGIEGLGGWIEKGLGKLLKPIGRGLKDGITKAFPEGMAAFEREAGQLGTRLGVWGLDLLEYGKKAAEGIGNGIERGVSYVTEKALGLLKAVGSPFARAGRYLWDKGTALAQGLKDGAVAGVKGIGSWAKRTFVDPVVNTVKNLFGIHSPSTVFASIGGDLVRGLQGGILDLAKGVGSWVWNRTGKPILNMFKDAGSLLLSKGRSFVSGMKNGIVDAVKGIGSWAWNRIVKPQIDIFANVASWLVSKGSSFVSGMKSGVLGAVKGIGSWAYSHMVTPQLNMFKNAGSWLHDKGGAMISGLKSGITGAVKGIGSWLKKYLVDPIVNAVKKYFGIHSPSKVFAALGGHLVSGLVQGLATTNGTAIARTVFGDLPSALGSIVGKGLVSVSSLPGKAMKALGSLGSKLGGLFGKLFGGGGSKGGVQQWASDVKLVLSMLGAPASALNAVLTRIGIESGGNPNAINLWDSNAKAGHPSQGLMQTIPETFNAYAGPFKSRGITDGLASIYAGVNYAMHRYGKSWISVMTRPGGYAKGVRGARRGLAWVGERGAELVNFGGGEDVLSHEDSVAFAKTHGIRLPGYASGTIQNAADRVSRDKRAVEDAKDAVSRAKRRRKGEAAAEKKLKAAEKELQAAETALANAKRSAKTSISNSIATGLAKTLGTGTASAITSAIKTLTTQLLNAGYNKTAAYAQRTGSKLESLATKKASVASTIATAEQYATDQTSGINDYLKISGTSATSVGDLISQMSGQQKTAGDFVSLSKSLQARGASKGLLQQLADAGPGSQLAAILSDRSVTTGQISKLNSLVSSGSKLATTFGQSMANLMYDSGAQAGKGFLSGLKAQEKELGRQMSALATVLVKEIKKSLKIKSPSQVMRDQVGKQIALGMVVGMDAHRPHIASAGRRLATTAYAASAGASSARTTSAFAQLAQLINSGSTEVHVHFDDPTLKDLIRVTTRPMIQSSASEQAHRAKVGRRS
ncbi:phage tail tape measure protein [Streptomyces murinus]|uniref:phage tail tape measure protein n=1 Tax=Streptomyces murinus TaxID=33900 RepID=UPI000A1DD856|nr:phage tail tape measure protein [Streptomyces murinus]WDO09963.1 phage tail tape measure protein [Streptomyces murinus]